MPRILVVDDSEVDRRLVGGLLGQRSDLHVDFAADGGDALERMGRQPPDLVVSDVQMPEVNGLQLVFTSRMQFPSIPVVLMTAHGSESMAVEALARGAASYVPKAQLAERLLDTVDEILALARADRTYDRLIGCLNRTEFQFTLDNDPALVDPLVDLVQQMAAGMRLCDFTERVRLGVALKEALLNALYRGNLELGPDALQPRRDGLDAERGHDLVRRRREEAPYAQRRVYVDIRIRPEEARFVVRDEGPGFDAPYWLSADGESALASPGAGRGLRLMQSFLDELSFNERGNEVTLVKRRSGEDPTCPTS